MRCQVLNVRFMKINEPWQEIRATEFPGGRYLDVFEGERFLTVNYISNALNIVKQINFNLDDVREYYCEYILEKND